MKRNQAERRLIAAVWPEGRGRGVKEGGKDRWKEERGKEGEERGKRKEGVEQ